MKADAQSVKFQSPFLTAFSLLEHLSNSENVEKACSLVVKAVSVHYILRPECFQIICRRKRNSLPTVVKDSFLVLVIT